VNLLINLIHSSFYRVLIATIKDMGLCLCPRCLTPKKMFSSLGLVKDMKSRLTNLRVYAMSKVIQARDFIYRCGNTVDGAKIEHTLGEGSWVPILVSKTVFLFFCGQFLYSIAESICREAWTFRSRSILDARCRLHAQV